MPNIWINDLNIEIIQEYKPRNRRTYIKPRYPNTVIITSPRYLSNDELLNLCKKFESYIYKTLKKKPKEKVKTNTIHLFGEMYNFKVLYDLYNHIEIVDKDFICYIKDDNTNINAIIDEYYYKRTKDFIEYYFDTIKLDMNLNFDIKVSYKKVKTYYGECIPSRREVIFSINLARYSPIYIKSVIYHELAHFYYRGHGDDFYILMEKKFPNYKRIQHEMRMKRYQDIY